MISRLHSHVVRRNVRVIGAVAILLVASVLTSLLLIRAFTIRSVVVDAPGMEIQLDAKHLGNNLLFLPTATLRQELLTSYPLLTDVRFEKKFPSTLIVHLVKRSAFAKLQSSGTMYAIDDHGLVLEVTSTVIEGYPLLVFDVGTQSVGNVITDVGVQGSLSLLRSLPHDIAPSRITTYSSQALLARMENTNIFLPQTSDLSAKATTLQIIIEGFRIKGTLPTVIDLRFEKPIITNE